VVGEFSKSRFGPLIRENPDVIGRWVKDTDSVTLKNVGGAFLYLRGARLSQAVGGPGVEEKESVALRSIPVDRVVFDELDLMDDEVVSKARGRMGASEMQEEAYLSNPTGEGGGIHRLWLESDQREWERRCGGCGRWQSADETFPGCVVAVKGAGRTRRRGRWCV